MDFNPSDKTIRDIARLLLLLIILNVCLWFPEVGTLLLGAIGFLSGFALLAFICVVAGGGVERG